MKAPLHLSRVLCLGLVVFGAAFVLSAQKRELPSGLTERSTLVEIIAWLDKTSFADARIGLNMNVSETYDPANAAYTTRHSEWAVFSKGFKLSKTDGCNLVLTNDDIKLLGYSSYYSDKEQGSLINFRNAADDKKRYTGDLYISLDKLNYKKAKTPYQHTNKADEEALFGTWRTEFKGKGDDIDIAKNKWRVPNITVEFLYDINLEIIGTSREDRSESFNSDNLTFTFDDKQASDKFYAAFRQAVKLCRQD
jgi:hypothetical protein